LRIDSNLKQEYESTGMVAQSFELANTNLIPALRKDGALFQEAIQTLRGDGHFRVPYLFTEAIASVAGDETLVKVIEAVLGENTPWVVWGPNIQQGTPNEADKWHVDIESWHWSTITVMIGLKNCNDKNTTRCIPYSHKLDLLPWSRADNSDDQCVQKAAQSLDPRCSSIDTFKNFQPGSFYLFDAKSWHCGPALSVFQDREMLILHYQRADDPRIPYMYDYEKRLWFDQPAVYLEKPHLSQQASQHSGNLMSSIDQKRFRTDLCPLPRNHQYSR